MVCGGEMDDGFEIAGGREMDDNSEKDGGSDRWWP